MATGLSFHMFSEISPRVAATASTFLPLPVAERAAARPATPADTLDNLFAADGSPRSPVMPKPKRGDTSLSFSMMFDTENGPVKGQRGEGSPQFGAIDSPMHRRGVSKYSPPSIPLRAMPPQLISIPSVEQHAPPRTSLDASVDLLVAARHERFAALAGDRRLV
uniref:Uncharacterized protein n=1 Tax=Emiliania huxleyi TaxID=2903 RepID=A0A6V2Z7G2_EMIHU|mmetsp:Transcript_17746/g.52522  ORF Transcript_17746/g.52522 Transcript_17746/m.52522 type:complete len:164 (+) Transcript_17746:77-568(+)